MALRPNLSVGLPLSCHLEARRDYFEIANRQTGAGEEPLETFSMRSKMLSYNEIQLSSRPGDVPKSTLLSRLKLANYPTNRCKTWRGGGGGSVAQVRAGRQKSSPRIRSAWGTSASGE